MANEPFRLTARLTASRFGRRRMRTSSTSTWIGAGPPVSHSCMKLPLTVSREKTPESEERETKEEADLYNETDEKRLGESDRGDDDLLFELLTDLLFDLLSELLKTNDLLFDLADLHFDLYVLDPCVFDILIEKLLNLLLDILNDPCENLYHSLGFSL